MGTLAAVTLALAGSAGCDGLGSGSDDDPMSTSTAPMACSTYPPQSASRYVLPYSVGASFVVSQGNCGGFTHLPTSRLRHAYDFRMPIGTAIVAARDGVVVDVEETYEDGNRIAGLHNFVQVQHNDGTLGRYLHLTRNGALVSPGESVFQGQLIGLSGDTGLSTEPHLHFDVVPCVGSTCTTVALTFRNTRPHPNGLIEGQSYTAFAF